MGAAGSAYRAEAALPFRAWPLAVARAVRPGSALAGAFAFRPRRHARAAATPRTTATGHSSAVTVRRLGVLASATRTAPAAWHVHSRSRRAAPRRALARATPWAWAACAAMTPHARVRAQRTWPQHAASAAMAMPTSPSHTKVLVRTGGRCQVTLVRMWRRCRKVDPAPFEPRITANPARRIPIASACTKAIRADA